MTGEPTHTTSKERMAPELMFSSERVPMHAAIKYCFESAVAITLCFQLCSPRYTALQKKNSRRSAFVTIQLATTIRAPPCNYQLLPRKCSGHYTSLSAIFSPLQMKNSVRISSAINPVTMHGKYG